MTPSLLTKTEVPHAAICREGYSLFWDERGVNLEHYMLRGNIVTSATYTDLLGTIFNPQSNPNDVDF
jgi:hypothetical protein